MGRPREHDPEEVLDAAVRTFWRRGYEGTSIRDLVDACGITTRTMYDAFRGKEAFFEAALDRYRETVLEPRVDVLRQKRGLEGIRSFARMLAAGATTDGCLFVNTAGERHRVRPAALRRVQGFFQSLHGVLVDKLDEARADGEFAGDSAERAAQLATTITGLTLAAKMGAERGMMMAIVDRVLEDCRRD